MVYSVLTFKLHKVAHYKVGREKCDCTLYLEREIENVIYDCTLYIIIAVSLYAKSVHKGTVHLSLAYILFI